MQISIDTSTDSHDHIRKVIDLLKNIVGDHSSSNYSSSSSGSSSNSFEAPTANAFAGIFGDSAPAPAPTPSMEAPPAAPASPQVVDIWGNPKKPDPDVGVEVY